MLRIVLTAIFALVSVFSTHADELLGIEKASFFGPSASALIPTEPTFTPLHTFFISPTGNDSNNGTSAGTPWLTPNHSGIVCGDVIIAAAGAYNSANFDSFSHGSSIWGTVGTCPSTTGGIDGIGQIYSANLVCGGTFVGACAITASTQFAMWVDKSNWSVQGFQASNNTSGNGTCFIASPLGAGAGTAFVSFINDIAVNCPLSGFQASGVQTNGLDEFAIVGTIEVNDASSASVCGSGITTLGPTSVNALAGTHQFISQNFAFGNINGPCSPAVNSRGAFFTLTAPASAGASVIAASAVSGWGANWPIGASSDQTNQFNYPSSSTAIPQPTFVNSVSGNNVTLSNNVAAPGLVATNQLLSVGTSTDGEGIILDTWGGTYASPAVVENNIAFKNGNAGFEFFCNTGNCATGLTVTFTQNTSYCNLQDYKHDGWGAELIDGGAGSFTWNVTNNLFQSCVTQTAGSRTESAWNGTTGVGFSGTGQPVTAAGFGIPGYNVSGNYFFGAPGAPCPSGGGGCNGGAGNNALANFNGVSYGSGNTFSDPAFASPGSLPTTFTNCNSFTNTVNCMAPVVAALTSGSAPSKGYQAPGPCVGSDPLFPIWLKGIVFIHWDGTTLTEKAGLITKPCGL